MHFYLYARPCTTSLYPYLKFLDFLDFLLVKPLNKYIFFLLPPREICDTEYKNDYDFFPFLRKKSHNPSFILIQKNIPKSVIYFLHIFTFFHEISLMSDFCLDFLLVIAILNGRLLEIQPLISLLHAPISNIFI